MGKGIIAYFYKYLSNTQRAIEESKSQEESASKIVQRLALSLLDVVRLALVVHGHLPSIGQSAVARSPALQGRQPGGGALHVTGTGDSPDLGDKRHWKSGTALQGRQPGGKEVCKMHSNVCRRERSQTHSQRERTEYTGAEVVQVTSGAQDRRNKSQAANRAHMARMPPVGQGGKADMSGYFRQVNMRGTATCRAFMAEGKTQLKP